MALVEEGATVLAVAVLNGTGRGIMREEKLVMGQWKEYKKLRGELGVIAPGSIAMSPYSSVGFPESLSEAGEGSVDFTHRPKTVAL